jgi:hypothetical protein
MDALTSLPQMEMFSGKSKASRDQIRKYTVWAHDMQSSIKMARASIERNWYLNLCFYFGRQYVVYRQNSGQILGTTGGLIVPPAPYYVSRPVINKIRPIIRTEISKLTSQKPSAYVVPASSEDKDLFAAQAGEQIWDSVYRQYKLHQVFKRAVWWNQICGNGFIKCYWDADQPDPSTNPPQQGKFCYSPETPFHIFVPDFREQELEDQPFVIHAQLRSKNWVKVNYPGVDYNNVSGAEEILEDTWLNLVGATGVKGHEQVLILECWVKPGHDPDFPEGAMFTVIGDSVVQSIEGWPYSHNNYPFVKLDHIESGKFYSDSTIVDLIPLQKELNRTRGQVIEAKNRMAKPKLVAERGAIIPQQITSEPGQVIEYEPGFPAPVALKMEPLPAYVTEELERINADMNDISGQHEISRGQNPTGVTAATAISYLQEQDDTKLASTFSSIESAYEKLAFLTLSYVQQYWNVPRIIKVVGTDASFDAMSFSGSDLNGNTDIRIEGGSALPTSRAAKQAFIMDLMKMGFIDPAKGLEVMEIGGLQKIYESVQQDVRQSQRENLKMAAVTGDLMMQYAQEQSMKPPQLDKTTGMPLPPPLIVPVNTWDNHQMHIEIHNRYRKSQAYDMLTEESKALFESHVNAHQSAMAIQAYQQMQMAGGQPAPPVADSGNTPPPDQGMMQNAPA